MVFARFDDISIFGNKVSDTLMLFNRPTGVIGSCRSSDADVGVS